MTPYEIQVEFDEISGRLTLSGSQVLENNRKYEIIKPSGTQSFRFTLSNANWLTTPIQWIDRKEKTPIARPFPGHITHESSTSFLLEAEINSGGTVLAFPFHLMVMHNGKIYYHDPVILNEPDDDPPPQG